MPLKYCSWNRPMPKVPVYVDTIHNSTEKRITIGSAMASVANSRYCGSIEVLGIEAAADFWRNAFRLRVNLSMALLVVSSATLFIRQSVDGVLPSSLKRRIKGS